MAGIRYVQISRKVEDDVLKSDIFKYADFAKIMAWKIGKINHKESQYGDKDIVFYKDWKNCMNSNPDIYGYELKLKEYHEMILFEGLAEKCYKEIIDVLLASKVKGIGPVYAITIMFFLTKGKYPIYDRFAANALEAISKKQIARPICNKNTCSEKVIKQYGDFADGMRCLMNELGEDNYLTYRQLDRALWVYGHGYK